MSRTVLAVAAHPDDEVLGAGATLAKHADAGDEVHVLIVTEGATAQYEDDSLVAQKEEEARRCADRLGVQTVHFGRLPDMRLDAVDHVEINAVIEDVCEKLRPDVVYTPPNRDVNRDHVAVHASVLVATRPGSGVGRVLAYEVPSGTEWTGGEDPAFNPNLYVDVNDYVGRKTDAFREYESEQRTYPHPRSDKAIEARATVRGTEAGFEAAEAFSVVRDFRTDP